MKKIKDTAKKVVAYVRRNKKLDYVALGASLVTFAAITLVNAPRASIWFDEAFGVYISQFSFWDIARFTATDVHPPLYYWFLKIWSSLFGTTELAYRSLSILFGVGVIITAFFLARKLFGRKVAGVSLLFLTVSPMLVRYSDEARMYTLSALIVFSATYVLVKAMESKSQRLWILYGVLISLGMWTHYFTALAWLAHWAWWIMGKRRPGQSFKELRKSVLTKEWVLSYAVAVGVFIPWLVVMVRQLGIVQGGGFWIGPVGVDTVNNYFTNSFYYLEHGQTRSWLALLLLVALGFIIAALPKAYRALRASEKRHFLLVSALAWVPPVLLFVASMPPLRSSFVERYLVPAIVALSVWMAIVLVVGTQRWKLQWRIVPVVLVAGMMIFGVTNVYKYGNLNRDGNGGGSQILTRQLIRQVQAKAGPGVAIVANDPWIFYEAIPYATNDNPIYFIDANTEYKYGSLDMLKYTDLHKIKDFEAFAKEHETIWYIGYTQADTVAPYKTSWQALQTVTETDGITGKTSYRATEYRITAE